MNSSLIEKLKKLLALGQSSNEHERNAALAKAAALAQENNIDMALLEGMGEVASPMVEERFDTGSKLFDPVRKFSSGIVCEFFNVTAIRAYKSIYFIGRKDDVTFAGFLFPYLIDQFNARWNQYKKTVLFSERYYQEREAQKLRNTFLYAAYAGLHARLSEERAELESRKKSQYAAAGGSEATFTLALTSEKDKRDEALDKFHPNSTKARSRPMSLRDASTLAAGRAAGRTISTNRVLAA